MSDLWKLVAPMKAALKHGCAISICDLARKNVSFGLCASSDKVKHNGGAVVGPAGDEGVGVGRLGSFGLRAFYSLVVFLLQCRVSTAIPFVLLRAGN